tara:strand:- start:6399 stop:7043 length:645 start_codon:yes stop_codon:yes gene_type:complete
MKKIKIFLLSIIMHFCFFVLFRTNRWRVKGYDNFQKAIENDYPIMLCTWHSRLLYASYFFKKNKTANLWAVASTHKDSELISRFLKKASINLIRGSSTRGGNNVTKQMLAILENSQSIIAITNDGPKGPPRVAKLESYRTAIKRNAQIIAISCNSTNFWRAHSWDRLHIPKPFGTIHINFSAPMEIKESVNDIKNTDKLNDFLNDELDKLDRSF